MKNYLLYDAGCAVCTGVAREVESASDGWLTVRSLNDPEMAAIVRAHDPSGAVKPRLVMERADGHRVLSGVMMTSAMVKGMGLRRSIKVSGIVHEALKAGAGEERRSFVRTMGLGVGVATGFAMGAAPAMAATEGSSSAVLGSAALSGLRSQAAQNAEFNAALRQAQDQGYSLDMSESVGIDAGEGSLLLFTFLGHTERGESDAAVITYEVTRSGERVALETVSGDISEVLASTQIADALHINAQTLSDMDSVLGPGEYFSCIAFCVGANCASLALRCRSLIFMYAVLACMVAVCGSKVNTCHKVCKSQW